MHFALLLNYSDDCHDLPRRNLERLCFKQDQQTGSRRRNIKTVLSRKEVVLE